MNIEISNEQIEEIIDKMVQERVKNWFKDPNNKYYIRNAIVKAVEAEVHNRINESMIDIPKLVSSLASKDLAEKITENVGQNIARYFVEKYNY